MKNNRSVFVHVLHLLVVVCVMVSTACAFEAPQTKPVIPAPQKSQSPIVQRQVVQSQTGTQAKSMPVSAAALPYSALQKETLPGSHGNSPLAFDGVKAAETFTGETAENTSRMVSSKKAEKSEADAAASFAADGNTAEAENSGSAQIFLVLVALCSALAGTAVILYLISKSAPQKEAAKNVSPEITQNVQPQVPMPLPPEEKPAEVVDSLIDEEPNEEDAAVELAQRYQRGQGEMQLLFSIRAHENEGAQIASLLSTPSSPKSKGNAKRLAKKIGLGKSEVELLVRLQKYGTAGNRSERIL